MFPSKSFGLILVCLLALTGNISFATELKSIGRGAKLIWNKDILIPANQDYIDLPSVSFPGPKTRTGIGYGMYFEDWFVFTHRCRVHLTESSLDPRRLPAQTEMEFSGAYQEIELDPNAQLFAQELLVANPKEVNAVTCGGYAQQYRSFLGENIRKIGSARGPVEMTLEDFKSVLAGTATLELPPPKDIP
jgi:hypothetical protein